MNMPNAWWSIIGLLLMLAACEDPVAQSHIRGNVPPTNEFRALLTRDLEAEFRATHQRTASVEFTLLRDVPTQSGVALPKFYAWVQVRDSEGKLIDEGAARVAAVERNRFDVLGFLSTRDIRTNPARVEQMFPQALADGIRARAGVPLAAPAK